MTLNRKGITFCAILLCVIVIVLCIRECGNTEQALPDSGKRPVSPDMVDTVVVSPEDTLCLETVPDVMPTVNIDAPKAAADTSRAAETDILPAIEPYEVHAADTVCAAETAIVQAPVAEDIPDVVAFQTEADEVKKETKSRVKRVWPEIYAAVKTNVVADAIAVPEIGLEFFMGPHCSFNLDGWYSPFNIFYKSSITSIHGLSPEIRCWFSNKSVLEGHFIGMHANFAWYTVEWGDNDGNRILYQNTGEGNYNNPANSFNTPNWSFGLTYGYYLRLGRKQNWGLEFYAGAGYVKSVYNIGRFNPAKDEWYRSSTESRSYLGITKLGVNLTYRFFR